MTAVTSPRPPLTGAAAAEAEKELDAFRDATNGIHTKQEEVDALSKARMRSVLRLRDLGVLVRVIAASVPTTEQTIYKIMREARRAQEAGEL